jgi:hypothetical protein
MANMKGASDLMTTLARIQTAPQSKRTALIAKAKGDLSKVQWSSPAMREWAVWAWKEGIR